LFDIGANFGMSQQQKNVDWGYSKTECWEIL